MRRLTTAIAVWMLVVTVAAVGWAASGDLDSVLGDVKWGDSKEEVIRKMKQQRIEALRNRRDLQHDRVGLQKARKQVIDKFERVEKSYTKLKGDKTGYEVSVIAGEFTKNAGEALMKVDDETAQRYYFFKDGKLYKLVVAYRQNQLEGIEFDRFLKRVISKYGKPGQVDRAKISGEKQLARAQWSGEETSLEVRNERQFFGTFVMVFADKKRVKKLRAKDEEFGGSGKNRGVSERVQSLTAESDDDQKDVVEGMIGEDIEVSLGEPADEEDKQKKEADKQKESEQTSAEATSSKTRGEGDGAENDESEETDEESEQRVAAPESDSDEKDNDKSESDSDDDKEKDELIVY